MINVFIGVGNLTKDVEMATTPDNNVYCKFTIAINRPKKTDGEQETDFLNVVVWGKKAENCYKYLKKGSKVSIKGPLRTRNYTAKDGTKRYATDIFAEEIEFLDSKSKPEASDDSLF